MKNLIRRHDVASDLDLQCLIISHKNDARLTIAMVENKFACMVLNPMNIHQTDLHYVRDYVADVLLFFCFCFFKILIF